MFFSCPQCPASDAIPQLSVELLAGYAERRHHELSPSCSATLDDLEFISIGAITPEGRAAAKSG